jgi:polyhydroxyalkanoate synthesis regulator phasin
MSEKNDMSEFQAEAISLEELIQKLESNFKADISVLTSEMKAISNRVDSLSKRFDELKS